MSKALSALLWKERREVGLGAGIGALLFFLVRFYGGTTAGQYNGEPHPITGYGAIGFMGALAFFLGVGQTSREAEGDRWAFALHRPASAGQIFGAKLMVGMGTLLVPMVIATAIGALWLTMPGDQAALPGTSMWGSGVVDLFCAFIFYAAGLYYGAHRGGKLAGLKAWALAVVGSVVLYLPNVGIALLVAAIITTVLTAAAAATFFSGSDWGAQPTWGRVANRLVWLLPIVVIVAGAVFPVLS